jgi:hypothetical protein
VKVIIPIKQREWQKPLVAAFRGGIKHAIEIAHRRAGKDRVALFIELEQALKQQCEVWHALPEQEHARKVIWDAITGDGQKLMEVAFPREIIRRKVEGEMKIELKNGSLWRLVGADRINALVGANPKHVTYSEFALMNPQARRYLNPILAENGGSELIITTPRGYNHAYDVYKYAQTSPNWYAAIHPVSVTKLISEEALAEERATTPDEIYRQEYECDFSAANLGAILGKYIEAAEREGRLDDELAAFDPEGAPLVVSSDIGYRDAAAFWFWQQRPDGFALVDYQTGSGMDADDWIAHLLAESVLADDGVSVDTFWLPHDARVKTFQSKHSALSRFLATFGADRVRITPQSRVNDRINAARVIMRKCRFSPRAADGVNALRNWQFKYDTERKVFSAEPEHDWASHGGDGFSYGAQVLVPKSKGLDAHGKLLPPKALPKIIVPPAHYAFTLDDLADNPHTNPTAGY